jgi:long-chain fatty acid transport protein
MIRRFRHTSIGAATGALALASGQVFGAGFAVQETSASGLDTAFAGGAAAAEDASTVWANPAGMGRFESAQAAVALHYILPSSQFHDAGSIAAAQQPLGNDGGDASDVDVVPNLYVVVPLDRAWAFGLGVNAPFGLVTDYRDGWIGRYQALESDVATINVNPSVSFKVVSNLSIGIGANWQRIETKLTNNLNYSGALAQAALAAANGGHVVPPFLDATTGLDAIARIDGDDDAWGWNVGLLWDANTHSRIGLHYRSSIKHTVRGDLTIATPRAPVLPLALTPVYDALATAVDAHLAAARGPVASDIELPPIVNASVFTVVADRWDLMADIQWTGWSTIKDLTFVGTSGTVVASTPEYFKDVWRFSVGANYAFNMQWKLGIGAAFDQTPVRNQFRTPRLPDQDRITVSGGAGWTPDAHWKVDLGAAYLVIDDGSIHVAGYPPDVAANALQNGTYDSDSIIVSGQATYTF